VAEAVGSRSSVPASIRHEKLPRERVRLRERCLQSCAFLPIRLKGEEEKSGTEDPTRETSSMSVWPRISLYISWFRTATSMSSQELPTSGQEAPRH